MDRLPEDSLFASTARHPGPRPQPDPDELIETLERALRAVVALPAVASPLVGLARRTLVEFGRLRNRDELTVIAEHVARSLHVNYEEILSRSRTQRLAYCRQIAMYVCRSLTGKSYPALGAHFGRDHTTVHYAVSLIARRMREDVAFQAFIHRIERGFTGRSPLILN